MRRGRLVWLALVLAGGLAFGQGGGEDRRAERLFSQGMRSYEKEDYETAVELITRAIAIAPSEPEYYFWRSYAYYWLNNGPQWEADLLRAIDLDPTNSAYHAMLAVVYFEKDDYLRAIQEYETTLGLDPNDWAAVGSVLGLYAQVGRYQDMIELLDSLPQRAVEQKYLDRDAAFVLDMYAVAYEGLGQHEKAEDYREKRAALPQSN